jgi:hypothetical protein
MVQKCLSIHRREASFFIPHVCCGKFTFLFLPRSTSAILVSPFNQIRFLSFVFFFQCCEHGEASPPYLAVSPDVREPRHVVQLARNGGPVLRCFPLQPSAFVIVVANFKFAFLRLNRKAYMKKKKEKKKKKAALVHSSYVSHRVAVVLCYL